METRTAIILCGGKGSRLGNIGKKLPKTCSERECPSETCPQNFTRPPANPLQTPNAQIASPSGPRLPAVRRAVGNRARSKS